MKYLKYILTIIGVIAVFSGTFLKDAKAAKYNLIIPLATKHTNIPDYYPKLQEHNRGLGIETVTNKLIYNLVYLKNNSYNKASFYTTISHKIQLTKNLLGSIGAMAATGAVTINKDTNKITDKTLLLLPIFSIRYKYLRIVTTYPFGKLSTLTGEDHTDFFNLQYITEF